MGIRGEWYTACVAVVQLFQVDDSLEVLVCWYRCISAYERLPRISILNIDDQIKVAYTMPLLLLLLLLHQLLLLTLLQLQPQLLLLLLLVLLLLLLLHHNYYNHNAISYLFTSSLPITTATAMQLLFLLLLLLHCLFCITLA